MPRLGPEGGWLLRLFGAHVSQAFGHTPYQVGSSLSGDTFRDVDVRLILPDDEYAVYFGNPWNAEHNGPRVMMWNFAWSALGKQMTRLPIDFQFQPLMEANGGGHEGPRSALLILDTDLPFVRTPKPATDKEEPSR